jgi:endonuclease/exonuclease/phosphatase family metal-dependent hydrolase
VPEINFDEKGFSQSVNTEVNGWAPVHLREYSETLGNYPSDRQRSMTEFTAVRGPNKEGTIQRTLKNAMSTDGPLSPQHSVRSSSPEDSHPHLTILLWNVWLLPPPLSDRVARARAKRISPFLQNYDVVVLNEAFVFKSGLLSQTKYPYKAYLGKKSLGSLLDSGLIILSAHPIVKIEKEHFDTRRSWDKLASKGVIFCRIQLPDESEIDIYGTHMQAGHSDSEQASRERQAVQLGNFILRHSGEKERHVVLAGDMNMGPAKYSDLSHYSVHYASPLDAKRRVGTYENLKRVSNLRDVVATGWEQDINRFLVRNIADAEVEYLGKPKYDTERNLSDSERLLCRISLPITHP